jgi:hypothetical protein
VPISALRSFSCSRHSHLTRSARAEPGD